MVSIPDLLERHGQTPVTDNVAKMWRKKWEIVNHGLPVVRPKRLKSFEIMSVRGENFGGETGIRTLGRLSPTTVFETAPIDHSGTSP